MSECEHKWDYARTVDNDLAPKFYKLCPLCECIQEISKEEYDSAPDFL